MTVIHNQRIYFIAVGLLALWVGAWGYFVPAQVDSAIPWLVPPLHARFLGAMYLSGVVVMLGCVFSRQYAEVRIAVFMTVIWTGMLFVISLFYLPEFDFARSQVWFWFGAYIAYPLIGLWLIWHDHHANEPVIGAALANWARAYAQTQGVLVTILAFSLMFFPDAMVAVWPWKISKMLAQIYSAPFLSHGVGALMLSHQRTWLEARVVLNGTFVFALGVLMASVIHRGLFNFTHLSALVWFAAFTIATVMLGVLSVFAIRQGGSR